MWKLIGYAAGALPVIVDLIMNSGAPSWVTGAGAAVVTGVKVTDTVIKKRKAGAQAFRSRP